MIFARKPEIAESAASKCEDLERRIADARNAIDTARAAADKAATASARLEATSAAEFAAAQREHLILERVGLEVARLEEAIQLAEATQASTSPLPGLIERRNALEVQLREVQRELEKTEFHERRIYRAISADKGALALLKSSRTIDEQAKQRALESLRETFGRL